MTLQGKVALVTGASREIGRAIAERLGEHGANVAVNYYANRPGAGQRIRAGGGILMSADTRNGTVGISGAGGIGQAFARLALRAGREVVIANSRGPESLAPAVATLGKSVSAGTLREAAASPMVVIAVPWTNVPAAVSEPVVDATNPFLLPGPRPAPLDGRTSSEIVAELVTGARLVKAANTLSAELLGAGAAAMSSRSRPEILATERWFA